MNGSSFLETSKTSSVLSDHQEQAHFVTFTSFQASTYEGSHGGEQVYTGAEYQEDESATGRRTTSVVAA